jgi:hypothetical protein
MACWFENPTWKALAPLDLSTSIKGINQGGSGDVP